MNTRFTEIIPVALLLAQATPPTPVYDLGWIVPVAQGSLSLGIIVWFMWRDGQERKAQDTRHKENLAAMAEVRTALRVHMELTIVGMRAVQTMDKGYADLLEQFGKQNHEPK